MWHICHQTINHWSWHVLQNHTLINVPYSMKCKEQYCIVQNSGGGKIGQICHSLRFYPAQFQIFQSMLNIQAIINLLVFLTNNWFAKVLFHQNFASYVYGMASCTVNNMVICVLEHVCFCDVTLKSLKSCYYASFAIVNFIISINNKHTPYTVH